MAMIDYGAMLRVDGEFITKNKGMFMQASDTGYVCEKAIDPYGDDVEAGREFDIDGNFFVYAGDEDFLVVFYRSQMKVIKNGIIIFNSWRHNLSSETHYIDCHEVKVSYLDKEYKYDHKAWKYYECKDSFISWEEYVRKNYSIYGEFSIPDRKKPWQCVDDDGKWSTGKKAYRKYLNMITGRNSYYNKYRNGRWLAEWNHAGKHYEVIFGYGIDNSEKVWENIKDNRYNFSDKEKRIIDSWFKEES